MDEPPASLDDLITYVADQHPDGGPLELLSDSVLVSERLDDLADRLVGHFVDRARTAGASWTEIGQSMGVSKQAAQKRFVPRTPDRAEAREAGLLDRFTGRARRVNRQAQEEARRARHDLVGTEHLVLGLLHDPECRAARAVEAQGVSLDTARRSARATLGPPGEQVGDQVRFSPGATKAKELALREAKRLGHDYVGTEHLLLGVLREGGPGARVLGELGITRGQAEAWIRSEIGRGRG